MIRPTACIALALGLTFVVAGQAASRSRYVPPVESRQIVAYFGRTYLPGWLPRGYVFARWSVAPGSGEAEYLHVFFGNHGRKLIWAVDDPADPRSFYSHEECSKHPFGHVATVNGRRVVYGGGAVGQTATYCIGKGKAVTVWNQYSVSRRTLERVAVSAAPVG